MLESNKLKCNKLESNKLKCKYCNNDNICHCGKSSTGKRRYKCNKCKKTFSEGKDQRIKHNI